MAEDDLVFDQSMKKKKKKKKMAFDGELGMSEETVSETQVALEEAPEDIPILDTEKPDKADEIIDDVLNFNKKKKKKKKIDMSELEDALPEEKQDPVELPEEAQTFDLENDLGLPLKKKKPKKKVQIIETDDVDGVGKDGVNEVAANESSVWSQHVDRDYTYDELLGRVFDIMRDKNPEMVSGEKKRFVMKPPQVMRAGAKKTSFSNFAEICKALHRMPKHLLAFLLSELGTSGSIDGSNQLIIKGRFQQKQIEHVLRRYIKEYVTCHTCRSPDTILQKDTRLYFLQCETCGSRCSVTSIKSGFQAVTGKRAAIRAKNA